MAHAVLHGCPWFCGEITIPTLQQLRLHLTQHGLRNVQTGVATSGSTVAKLEDLNNLQSPIAENDRYEGGYIFRPNAGLATDKLRRIAPWTGTGPPGYDPTTGLIWTGTPNWSTAPYATGVGEAYELHWHGFEPLNQLTAIINEALKYMFVMVEFTITPVINNQRTTLITQPWIIDANQIYQVGWLAQSETRDLMDPFRRIGRGEVIFDGTNFYLQHNGYAFNPSDTIYVRAKKRLYDHVAPSGGTAYGTQSGLNLEGDSIPPLARDGWVTSGALVQAWYEFPLLMAPGANEFRIQNLDAAQHQFNAWTEACFRPPRRSFVRLEFSVSHFGGPPAGLWTG